MTLPARFFRSRVAPKYQVYIAYASDSSGTNFSRTPSANSNYIAFLTTEYPIEESKVVASLFSGLWTIMGNQPDDDTLELNEDGKIQIKSGGVGATELTAGCVSSYNIENGSIDEVDLKNNCISNDQMQDDSIDTDELVDEAVTRTKIGSAAVGSTQLGTGSVTNDKISDEAVTESKIGSGAVSESKIWDGAVSSDKIYNGAVTTDKISDGNVTTNKLEYKEYIAEITQSGVGSPIANVIKNTLGETPSLVRSDTGKYEIQTVENVFTEDKTFIMNQSIALSDLVDPFANLGLVSSVRGGTTAIYVMTTDMSNTPADSVLYKTNIMIRVYP